MKRVFPLVAGLFLGLAECALSQGGVYGYPLDVPADSRSFAMGESFAGVPSNPNALMYNPASLAGLAGVHASYSQRRLDRENDGTLRSFNVSVGTSFGVFGVQYNRDSYGELPVTLYEGAPPVINSYDYDVAAGYGLRLGRRVSVGVALKYYEAEGYIPGSSNTPLPTFSAKPATLFDVGLIFTVPFTFSRTVVRDSVTLGVSYQNIGATSSLMYPGIHIESVPPELPQYFRAGLSYALRVIPREKGDVSPFQAVIAGEFRSVQTTPSPFWLNAFWGFGMECTIEEFLSLRAGTSSHGGDLAPFMRYGLAVLLPVRELGFDLSIQYAVVPWHSLSTLSIDIQTSGSLF